MNKYLKVVAVAVMVAVVAAMTPTVGQAAVAKGAAGLKQLCMREANIVAKGMKAEGEDSKKVLSMIAETLKDGDVTVTDTELLCVYPGDPPLTQEITIYPHVRQVRVTMKCGNYYESATANY